ncbi:MAG: hypothetical protein KJO98_13060 [Rhodothermia bacterium]|nr:hypothetical protein [Rhodothermia bacterium]
MSRVLLIILAILSAVFAAVLGVSLLYVVALALLLAAGGLWLLGMKGKFDVGKPDSAGFSPVAEDDLNSLGILEIRPKAANGSHRDVAKPHGEDVPETQTSVNESAAAADGAEPVAEVPARNSSAIGHQPMPPVRKKADASRLDAFVESSHRSSSVFQMISVAEDRAPDVLGPCLESLASAINANTVALIRQTVEEWTLVAIVSQNAYARGASILPVTSEMPFRATGKGKVVVEDVSKADWDVTDLKYYRGEIAIREVARVDVPTSPDDERVILVADSVRRGVLDSAQSKRLLQQYARLLGTLLDAKVGTPLKPRREIIAEEIQDARVDGRPLALALVLLNRADKISERETMEEAEAALIGHLAGTSDEIRVERFGDLMVGVFHRSDVTEVEAWAARVQADLADLTGPLEGGVSVGVAMMTDRHSRPEMLRADAAAALEEAFESGACTILE